MNEEELFNKKNVNVNEQVIYLTLKFSKLVCTSILVYLVNKPE
jgi:hypothetical protein